MNGAKQLHTGFVETNGTKLYYEVMGEGHPLVLLHGGYMDRRMWDDQFAVFAQYYSEYSFAWVLDPAPKQELVPPAYERLTEIHVPALIIVGAEDHFQLHKSADKLEHDIAGARRVTISETHHMPNMEKLEVFNRIVLDFLKTLKREGAKGYVLRPGESIYGAGSGVKAGRASTGGSLTLIESHTRGGAPMHVHSREDECFYVMEGSITVHCGDDVFEAGPQSFVFLPRGIPHAWDVSSKGVATLLIITVPGGFEDFLREHHEAGSMPDDVKDQIAAKYGIEWIRNPDRDTLSNQSLP